MSEASERLRDIIEDGAIDIWPDISGNIKTVLDELDGLDALREAQVRLWAIYTERGKMVAEMRELLNRCY